MDDLPTIPRKEWAEHLGKLLANPSWSDPTTVDVEGLWGHNPADVRPDEGGWGMGIINEWGPEWHDSRTDVQREEEASLT